jgi:lambda repressor-like predicted transcriptional regulator
MLEPHERTSEWLSNRIATILADEYERGTSIHKLSQDTGYSIQRVRTLLERAGVKKRNRGRPVKAAVAS